MFKYFPDPTTTSEDEAKALRKQLARQYHPDQGGDAAKMSEINTEFSRWIEFKRNPPIFVPAPTKWADPNSWWSAITGAVKQVKVEPVPPPPPSQAPASVSPPPAPRPAPPPAVKPTRKARAVPPGPKVPAAVREQEDYDAARLETPDAHGHKAHGVVTILYTSYLGGGLTIEAVEIRGAKPRHQIRENGTVMFERPATKAWVHERKDLIARASARNY